MAASADSGNVMAAGAGSASPLPSAHPLAVRPGDLQTPAGLIDEERA
jgi:hypothetical protein